jgi:Flp pilus assembly pilin Flp
MHWKIWRSTMKCYTLIEKFRKDEAGAVTVDWVVLTAAIVGLGLAVVASVRTGANSVGSQISSSLSSASVVSLGTLN